MASALSSVQKLFPNVTHVVDAKNNRTIEVTKKDTTSATVRSHKACAMAVACKRKLRLDGVMMAVSTAYLISGNTATRYRVPPSVAREITAFDRNAEFEPGEYQLTAIGENERLGKRRGKLPEKGGPKSGNLIKRFRHKTGGIRASLGSKHLV
jgi:hypothetical protein